MSTRRFADLPAADRKEPNTATSLLTEPAYAPLPEMTPVPLAELTGLGTERPTFAFDCGGERYVLVGDVLMQYEAPGTQASEDFHTSIARTAVMLDEQAIAPKEAA